MQCFFMRHGQTNYNLQGLCNGDPTRDVHLTATGIEQARQAAEQLRDQHLDIIMVSQLPRTRQTAELVNQYHQVEIQTRPALNDIRSGFEDRPVAEYQAAIAADPLHSKFNDGESLLEHKHRIEGFLNWLRRQRYHAVLIVAHEETLRVVVGHFQQIPDDAMHDLHFKNCEILSFELP